MTDPIDELAALLTEVGAKVTISPHCRSGIVPRGAECICWRCRGESGPTDDESHAEAAAKFWDMVYLTRIP